MASTLAGLASGARDSCSDDIIHLVPMRSKRRGWPPASMVALLLAALIASLCAVFHAQLLSGFGLLTGDRLDGLIQTSILEHWFNVLRGRPAWDTMNYFHPHRGTLAYNDGYLLYGLAYSGFRALGLDPFLSAEAVNIILRVAGFAGAYRFARGVLRLARGWAALGAVLFTVCLSVYQQSAHAQILSVALAPWAALLTVRAAQALEAARSRAALGWGAALAALASAWLLTAFYMAWLLGFYGLVLALAGLTQHDLRQRAVATLRREWRTVAAIGLMFAVGATPFLWVYLPKAWESGMHSYAALRPYLPGPLDTIRVGPGNLLFGWSDRFLAADAGASVEKLVGWPPIQLACFAVAVAWGWRRPAMRPAILAVGVVYVLSLEFRGASGWWLVYHAVPGAKAIRAVSRAWIVLAGPVLCIVLMWLQGLGAARPRLAAALAVLLVLEQLSSGPKVAVLDRADELRRLAAMLPPAPECRAFTVLSARDDDPEANGLLQLVSPNTNAMLIAEVSGLPAINGLSTFNPRGYDLGAPISPGYRARASAYARAHGVTGLCGLDLRTGRWYEDLAHYVPLHLAPTGGPLSMREGEAGEALLDARWHAPQPWGRWGQPEASLRFVAPGGPGPLHLTAWALGYPRPPARRQRVAVLANGRLVTVWSVAAEPAELHALLPPHDPKDPIEVTFLAEDPVSPQEAGDGVDNNVLGIGLISVQLDRP